MESTLRSGIVVDVLTLGLGLGVPVSLVRAGWILHGERYLQTGLHRLSAMVVAESLVQLVPIVVGIVAADACSNFYQRSVVKLSLWPLTALAGGVVCLAPLAVRIHRFVAPQLALLDHEAMTHVSERFFAPSAVWIVGLLGLLVVLRMRRRSEAGGAGGRRSGCARLLHRPLLAAFLGAAAAIFVVGVELDGRLRRPTGPNVVIIVVDTLRADHLDLYGYFRETAPNLRALAADAIWYRNAVSTAPWTTPAVTSALTGHYPTRYSSMTHPVPLPPRATLLPEVLRNEGYRTFGAVANILASGQLGFDQGFEVFEQREAAGAAHVSSEALTERAGDFLDQAGASPFLLYLLYFDPHYGYALHTEFDFDPDYDGWVRPNLSIQTLRDEIETLEDRDLRYLRALYDSEIRFTDLHLGKLIDDLKQRGLYDDALLVVFSDHGEEFAERGWIGHTRKLYEELIHVPLLIKLPGNQGGGSVIEEPVSILDVAPTLLAEVGLDFPGPVDGRVLSRQPSRPRPQFSETRRFSDLISVRLGPWKLIKNAADGTRSLFDLSSDPRELFDVAAENPERVRELEAMLAAWQSDLPVAPGDQTPAEFTEKQKRQLRSLGYLD